MNKNFRIITINGVRGILTVIFIAFGLIAGFIVSPGWVCMQVWNIIFKESSMVALMNIYQGIMLWSIIALSLYALNNKRALIGFGSYRGLSPEQINDIISGAKLSEPDMIRAFENINKELKKRTVKESAEGKIEEKPIEAGTDCNKENFSNEQKEETGR